MTRKGEVPDREIFPVTPGARTSTASKVASTTTSGGRTSNTIKRPVTQSRQAGGLTSMIGNGQKKHVASVALASACSEKKTLSGGKKSISPEEQGKDYLSSVGLKAPLNSGACTADGDEWRSARKDAASPDHSDTGSTSMATLEAPDTYSSCTTGQQVGLNLPESVKQQNQLASSLEMEMQQPLPTQSTEQPPRILHIQQPPSTQSAEQLPEGQGSNYGGRAVLFHGKCHRQEGGGSAGAKLRVLFKQLLDRALQRPWMTSLSYLVKVRETSSSKIGLTIISTFIATLLLEITFFVILSPRSPSLAGPLPT